VGIVQGGCEGVEPGSAGLWGDAGVGAQWVVAWYKNLIAIKRGYERVECDAEMQNFAMRASGEDARVDSLKRHCEVGDATRPDDRVWWGYVARMRCKRNE
jgi:hypothetical protein